MWDAASVWFDEQCHVHTQDSIQWNTGPPAAEHVNLTTRPRGQPQVFIFLNTKFSIPVLGLASLLEYDIYCLGSFSRCPSLLSWNIMHWWCRWILSLSLCCRFNCVPLKDMSKSEPLVAVNVIVLENKVIADVIGLRLCHPRVAGPLIQYNWVPYRRRDTETDKQCADHYVKA